MKIYNKKGWVLGMGEILLGIVGVCIYVQTGFQTFDWKAGTLLILLFSFGVSGIVRSCSKKPVHCTAVPGKDDGDYDLFPVCHGGRMYDWLWNNKGHSVPVAAHRSGNSLWRAADCLHCARTLL